MKTWKMFVSGILASAMLVTLTGASLAAEVKATEKTPEPAGQFTRWFSELGIDPGAPKATEDVLSRMGAVIKQTKTAGGASVTLNGAVWDGEAVRLSLSVKGKNLPKELTRESRLYTEECGLSLPETQWKDYVRKDAEALYAGRNDSQTTLEERVKSYLDKGQDDYWRTQGRLSLGLLSREGDTLTLQAYIRLNAYLNEPELTLHLENLAIYESDEPVIWQNGKRTGPGPGVSVLKGPFDFTFQLSKAVLPVSYTGDVKATCDKIPLQFTKLEFSVLGVEADYQVLAPVNPVQVTRPDAKPEAKDPNKLDQESVTEAVRTAIRGVWMKDGRYANLSNRVSGLSIVTGQDGQSAGGSINRFYPYPIDPASVTAVDLGGTRVELSRLERVTE